MCVCVFIIQLGERLKYHDTEAQYLRLGQDLHLDWLSDLYNNLQLKYVSMSVTYC